MIKAVLLSARTNVAALRDRGLHEVKHILVPVGGGPHARLAIRLAHTIAEHEGAQLTALHTLQPGISAEDAEDQRLRLREIVADELGAVPSWIDIRVAQDGSVLEGILAETRRQRYDLIVIGASEEWIASTPIFGTIDDQIAEQAPCSVLLVRRHESIAIAWIRRQARKIEPE
jgi:nucleotide-binding universal stress UspA family protein